MLYLLDAGDLGRQGHWRHPDGLRKEYRWTGGHVMGGPVPWKSDSDGPLVYNWSEDDNLIAYSLSGRTLSSIQCRAWSPRQDIPRGFPDPLRRQIEHKHGHRLVVDADEPRRPRCPDTSDPARVSRGDPDADLDQRAERLARSCQNFRWSSSRRLSSTARSSWRLS